jgi:hypothetical protein
VPCLDAKKYVQDLAAHISEPRLPTLLRQFLYHQLHDDDNPIVPLRQCPKIEGKISLHHCAAATFFAPSDLSGIGGMRREHIRANPKWRGEEPRRDCVFINTDARRPGMRGMDVARVLHFLSFTHNDKTYPCAVVHLFATVDDEPDSETGMWVVEPLFNDQGEPFTAVFHLGCIIRAALLIGQCGEDFVPNDIVFHQSLDHFKTFYVNKFADHHVFEIAF